MGKLKLRAESATPNRKEWDVRASIRALLGLPSTRINPSLFAGRIRESCEILTRVEGLPAKFIQQIFNTRSQRSLFKFHLYLSLAQVRYRDIRDVFYASKFHRMNLRDKKLCLTSKNQMYKYKNTPRRADKHFVHRARRVIFLISSLLNRFCQQVVRQKLRALSRDTNHNWKVIKGASLRPR